MDFHLPDPSTLRDLEAVAVRVASACGRLIVDGRPEQVGVAATKSSLTDVVTEMDRRSEQLAGRLLADERPDDGIVGEEGADQGGSSPITWLVDPIDGTVNYLYGLGHYAVSVAAVVGDPRRERGWRPVAGAVLNAATGEMYSAHTGGGARLDVDGRVSELQVHRAESLGTALVATGFGYEAGRRARQGRVLADLLPQVRDVRRMGAAALDLCAVARGSLDAYYEGGVNAWDVAAGWVIVEEAGGVVRGPQGRRPSPALVLAGADPVLGELEGALVETWAQAGSDAAEPDLR